MKMKNCQKILAMTAVISLTLLASNALAQFSSTPAATPAPAAAPTAAANQTAPPLSQGVSEVLQLARANVGEDVIVNFIQNSHDAYGLTANQIIYLKQQGISDRIVNAMMNQPKPDAAAPQPTTASVPASAPGTSTATVAPSVTYVQPAPSVTYVQPAPTTYYYPAPYNYPAYSGSAFPPVSLSFGWFWGSGGGGGWHGGGWHH